MPRLWDATIDAHRRAVQDAVLDATATLAARHGLASVKMSQVAQESGIGRATLYKYFPDVDSILVAWHERQVGKHLARLREVPTTVVDPIGRLAAVLEAYAVMSRGHGHGDGDLVVSLHGGQHVAAAHRELHGFLRGLIEDASAAGRLAGEAPADELASFCLHALGAAADLRSADATRRLVEVTLRGLGCPDRS